MKTRIKTHSQVQAMRDSGRMLATVLDKVSRYVEVGVTTKQLADIAASELRSLGGSPAFLGHQDFPDVICTSINDEIVHGIPSPRRSLKNGDLLGLDFGVTYKGMITDGAISIIVGTNADPRVNDLVRATKRALDAGVSVVRDGVRVGDISDAIEQSLAHGKKYGVPRDLVGHGVGRYLWEEPNIPNYGSPKTGPRLSAGMTIAIEPMVTLGSERITVADDGWTIMTEDGSWAAHFEHTVLILQDSVEILTKL